MHVALVYFCSAHDGKSAAILKKLEAASVARGNQVELINGNEDIGSRRLTMFDYIAVVVAAMAPFGSKIPSRVGEFLAASGNITGKKGCALVIKAGLRSDKTCSNLMRTMEAEGVKLDYFEVVRSVEHASYAGGKIG